MNDGDAPKPHGAADLLPLVYNELRALAAARLAAEPAGHTLQPTALVHEVYLRLASRPGFPDRSHFLAAAGEAMRRLLVDHARKKRAGKRGRNVRRVFIDPDELPGRTFDPDELMEIDEALTRFATTDPAAARLAALRLFAGLSVEEAGAAPRHVAGVCIPGLDVRPGLAERGPGRKIVAVLRQFGRGMRRYGWPHFQEDPMPADPNRLKDLFLAAAALPIADRPAFLAEACNGDSDLLAAAERLLAAHVAPDSRIDPDRASSSDLVATCASFAPGNTGDSRRPEAPGLVLASRYKLVEPIGEGGMGTVWMAQQVEPIKRVVAVKLIKAGMDSRAVLARFEAERQALALMDHPNIAKVLDAGMAADGRPFFVLELVKGVPITRFCDDRRLSPRERLALFIPVCQAIQHAHQKGIIHRDIKPSNVLVALFDDQPVPKVIDFGVAKAAGQHLTDKTLLTGFGAVIGTPEYMSPEQASFNQLDVDTRSDIYSLGVLLYELLAGTPPHPQSELEKAGMLEVLRVIREVEPPRPSARLSTSQTLASLAAVRGTEPAQLTRLVRGEIDWIVMKALEKDRSRRYETASGLAADVQRYLAGDTVAAAPRPSAIEFGNSPAGTGPGC